LNQVEEAEAEFEKVLALNPTNSAARNGMGRVAIARQEFERAREILSPVASQGISETGAEAQFLIGQSYRLEGRNAEAMEAYANVRVLHEAFGEWVGQAMYEMAALHIIEGRPGDARELLNELIENYQGTVAAGQAARLLQSVE
jgi:tetratricopeptide (TPR) repeat protein